MTQIDSTWVNTFSGDETKNDSYFGYGDTLLAVASGTVLKVVNGRAENSGNLRDAVLTVNDEYYGNYLVLDIGSGYYAMYMHCLPNSFFVQTGDVVAEGQPIARLGNSGNSTEPHLHFQLVDKPDPAFSHGLPFIFKSIPRLEKLNFLQHPVRFKFNPLKLQMQIWRIGALSEPTETFCTLTIFS